MKSIYGYFDDDGAIPAYDPGLDVDCPICHKKLEEPVVTPSFIAPYDVKDFLEGSESTEKLRSYFYRVHRDCLRTLPHEEQIAITSEIEGVIIDAIWKGRQPN